MFISSIIIAFVVIVIVVLKLRRKYDVHKIPGPPGYPIIGNVFDILKDRVSASYDLNRLLNVLVTLFKRGHEWSTTYDGIFKLQFLHVISTVVISKPEDIETVVSTPIHNDKEFPYFHFEPWLKEGLLLSTGKKWHQRRKILTPTFHFQILRHFNKILEDNSEILVKTLEGEVGKVKTDIIPLISGYTLNAICETAMGTKIKDKAELGRQYKESIHEIGTIVIQRITNCLLHFDFIFNLTSRSRKQKKVLQILREFPNQIIAERRQYREEHGNQFYLEENDIDDLTLTRNKKRLAMLDLLLDAEKDNKIDQSGIQEEIDTFMFEGHDTTGTAMNYALMCLANYKHIQDKVVEELRGIFGDSDRAASMEDLSQLKYLECFIKETLRLYPPVHFIGRKLGEDVTLSNYRVPAGAWVNVHISELHRRSDIYPNPLVFDPDRFLPENSANRHPFAYIPFSAGPRNCIGQRFAMMEMKSALAAILRRLELRPVTRPEDIEFSADLVLRSVNPIYVSFNKRK